MQTSTTSVATGITASNAYTDFSDLAQLRRAAQKSPQQALAKVARQFESLFIKMMLKSMREAAFGDPIFDSNQSELYRDMFDNQIALNMAEGKGIGLADALLVQLRRYIPQKSAEATQPPAQVPRTSVMKPFASAAGHSQKQQVVEKADEDIVMAKVSQSSRPANAAASGESSAGFADAESFVRQLLPLARQAGDELGVAPQVLIAQAALETGWGKAVSRHADGSSSYNLFNIKADDSWTGKSVVKSTLEFKDGIARREFARFRAYDSFADSFHDYVQFLKGNPRYQSALQVAHHPLQYIKKLQQSGYATDPDYADKIINIMQRDYLQAAMFDSNMAVDVRG